MARHPERMISELALQNENLSLELVESAYLPKLGLSAGIGREDSNNASTRARIGGSEEMERRESSITLRQLLFDGFETHRNQQGQEKQIAAARMELEHTGAQLALDAIRVHLESIEANSKFDFNMESYRAHERIAEGIRARVKSGKDNRAKVAQVEARLALALANLETAKAGVFGSQTRYMELAGDMPGELKEDKTLPRYADSIEVLTANVLENNPLLAARELSRAAAEEQYQAKASNRYPDVFFDAGASWNSNLDGVEGRNSDAYGMFRLQYDLYSGGALRTERKQARLFREQASLERDLAQRELISEASQLWYNIRSASKQVEYLESYIASALLTKEAYQKQFDIGQRSLIDLLDAENELLAAREKWLGAKLEHQLLVYRLAALEGTLLDQLKLELPSSTSGENG